MAAVMITNNQIKLVHTLKSAIHLNDSSYCEILDNWFRVSSSKELNSAQAEELISELKKHAVSIGAWESQPDQRKKFDEWESRAGGMATPQQLRKIEVMWHEISRTEEPGGRKKALRSFLERVVKVSDLRFLDFEGAGKIINALQAMGKRKTA